MLQTGTAIDLHRVGTDHAVEYILGVVTNDSWSVSLQGSLDGADWYDIGGAYSGTEGGAPTTIAVVETATFKPARFIRATGSASVGSPTVTALVTSR